MRSSCTVAGPVGRELHDLNLGAAKPLRGIGREEKEAGVPGRLVIVHPHRQPHAAVDFPFVRLLKKPAAHVAQELAHFRLAQVLDLGVRRPPVVPRHAGRLLNQAPQQVATPLGVNGLGAETNPVPPRPVI